MKLAIAAVLVAAAGAWAQSECCSSQKAEAVVQTVAAETTTCEQACESTQQVAQTASCTSTCETTGAAVQTVALEGDDCCGDCSEVCQEACEDKGAVQTVAFPADMPMMTYVVGEKETRCSMEAGELASSCETLNVAYKVAGKSFDCQQSAGKAYAAALHNYVDNMTRVSFVVDGDCTSCPFEAGAKSEKTGKAMQYKVGNTTFDCADKAIRAAALAHYQVQQVKLAHAVNGEVTQCSDSFAAAKACSETKATFVVGAKQTECEIEASCLLEMARVEAAIAACQMVANQG